jgi:hypothetical protein
VHATTDEYESPLTRSGAAPEGASRFLLRVPSTRGSVNGAGLSEVEGQMSLPFETMR